VVLGIGLSGKSVRNNASGRQSSWALSMAVTELEALVQGAAVTPLEGFFILTLDWLPCLR